MNFLSSLILTFIIFFGPLAFGAVHLWSRTILQLAILLAFSVYIINSITCGGLKYRRDILNSFFFLFISIIILQLFFGITKDAYKTTLGLKTTILYFALFLTVTNYINKRSDIDNLLFKITLAGSIVAVLGILQRMADTDKIYWIVQRNPKNFFAAFINENHAACYISMTAFVTIGTVFADIYGKMGPLDGLGLKRKILSILDVIFNQKVAFRVFAFLIMACAVFMSGSRSGIVFFGITGLFFISAVLAKTNFRKSMLFIILGIFIVCALLNWIGPDKSIERLGRLSSYTEYLGRVSVNEEGLNVLKDHPFSGIGVGAFANIFPAYRRGFETSFFLHLHNDILQLAIELGIIGFLIVSIPFLMFLFNFAKETSGTKNAYKYYILLGLSSSFIYLGWHSLVDFSMRINAVSSLFIILLSAATLTMRLEDKEPDEIRCEDRKIFGGFFTKSRTLSYVIILIIFSGAAFIILKPFLAYSLTKNPANLPAFEIAIKLDPKNGDIYYKYHEALQAAAGKGVLKREAAYAMAKAAIDKACLLNPYKTDYIIASGWLDFKAGDYKNANVLFQEAVNMEPDNYGLQLSYSYILFLQALDEKDALKKKTLLGKGLIYYKRAGFFSTHVHLYDLVKNRKAYDSLREGLKKEGIFVE